MQKQTHHMNNKQQPLYQTYLYVFTKISFIAWIQCVAFLIHMSQQCPADVASIGASVQYLMHQRSVE